MATSFQLTIDCLRPERLVAFWQPLLGYDVPAPPEGFATWRGYYRSVGVPDEEIEGDGADRLVPPDGEAGVRIWFQQVPETKSVKNRLHLDLHVSRGREVSRAERRADLEVAVAGLEARGGSLLRWTESDGSDHVFALMADPEGNEFCLV